VGDGSDDDKNDDVVVSTILFKTAQPGERICLEPSCLILSGNAACADL